MESKLHPTNYVSLLATVYDLQCSELRETWTSVNKLFYQI